MVSVKNIDAGDGDFYRGQTVTLDAGSNSVSGGDAVTFDGSGNITRTTADTDAFIGVVLPESDEKADSKYTVHLAGHVVAMQLASDATASPGDLLYPSATDAGRMAGGGDMVVDASTTSMVYTNHPIALESGGNNDVILAAMR